MDHIFMLTSHPLKAHEVLTALQRESCQRNTFWQSPVPHVVADHGKQILAKINAKIIPGTFWHT